MTNLLYLSLTMVPNVSVDLVSASALQSSFKVQSAFFTIFRRVGSSLPLRLGASCSVIIEMWLPFGTSEDVGLSFAPRIAELGFPSWSFGFSRYPCFKSLSATSLSNKECSSSILCFSKFQRNFGPMRSSSLSASSSLKSGARFNCRL